MIVALVHHDDDNSSIIVPERRCEKLPAACRADDSFRTRADELGEMSDIIK